MPRSSKRALLALGAGAAALGIALPALGQKAPQSLLPPGFGAPPAPAPTPPATPAPAAGAEAAPAEPAPGPVTGGESLGGGVEEVPANTAAAAAPSDLEAAANAQAAADNAAANAQEQLLKQNIPDVARRPTDHIGFLSPAETGVAADGFGTTSGAFLGTLLARLDAPLASRWMSMLLRRVLTTDLVTPAQIDPADWVAERALALTRMGEADAARLLVQRLDPDKATPRYNQAVLAAAMAAADPAALCPVADAADAGGQGPAWPLARAMCAGLSGEGGTAAALLDRARAMHGEPKGIDMLLAERVIGAGTNARRAVNIEWAQVDKLTPWRFGLASAVGLTIPDSLFQDAGLAMTAWRARAPMLPFQDRAAAERVAATLGVVSSADLVDFYALLAQQTDPYAMDQSVPGRLRTAYVARDISDRVAALRALWTDPTAERDQYAARILTARAAERVPVSADYKSSARMLIEAMLSAGLDEQAARWAPIVRGLSGSDGDEAWALLAVGAPQPVVPIAAKRITGFGNGGRGSTIMRRRFLLAALAGLGRISPSEANTLAGQLQVPLGSRNPWTQAIDGAAQRGEPATVALLAAVGMQTPDWNGVSPSFLYHIVADLRRVGFEPEARMIAAEALMRT